MIRRLRIELSAPKDNMVSKNYYPEFTNKIKSITESIESSQKVAYSVSGIQGLEEHPIRKDMLYFNSMFYTKPYFYVTSGNTMFLRDFLHLLNDSIEIHGMTIGSVDIENLTVNRSYDIVESISPIIITDGTNKGFCTIQNQEFIERLNDITKHMLSCNGYSDKDFAIELAGNTCKKIVTYNGSLVPSSLGRFKIIGSVSQREFVLSSGLGLNTKSGFGSVSIVRSAKR